MPIPPAVVIGFFLVAALSALAAMAYIAFQSNKPSDFYNEAINETYDMVLPKDNPLYNAYWDTKEALIDKTEKQGEVWYDKEGNKVEIPWVRQLAQEDQRKLQEALERRLVAAIERLDQVRKDKPGNWKLWKDKLVSENYWQSLLTAEEVIHKEVDECLEEVDDLWAGAQIPDGFENVRDFFFQSCVQAWRMDKHAQQEKKEQKKAVEVQKKLVKKEAKKEEQQVKLAEEELKRQEIAAQKAMEKLLREEENENKKSKGKKSEPPTSGSSKAKAKKK